MHLEEGRGPAARTQRGRVVATSPNQKPGGRGPEPSSGGEEGRIGSLDKIRQGAEGHDAAVRGGGREARGRGKRGEEGKRGRRAKE